MYARALMEQIKENKSKDFNQVEVLCGDLLELANKKDDTYAKAFAHTYLADNCLQQRHHTSCIQHLKEAQVIAEACQYHELLLLIYNIGGIYYKSHFDEASAIKYYIDAYNLAVDLNDYEEIMVTLNNVAELFSLKDDFKEALSYIKRAYDAFLKKGGVLRTQRDLIIIMNLVELYILNKQLSNADEVYNEYEEQLEAFHQNPATDAIIRICKMYLLQAREEYAEVYKEADFFINGHFQTFEKNRTLSFNFFTDVYEIMLRNKEQKRAEKALQRMGEVCLSDDIEQQLRLHLSWIKFAETFHLENALIQSYKQYYLLQKMVTDITNKTKAESMKEKILLNHMIKEHKIIEQEKRILETQVKIDDLTRLFNRNYFNKLYVTMKANTHVSKIGFILVDVDYFKEYNDYYGHYQGDNLLKKIARCLDENGDSRFFAARFGGDEFIILCVNVTSEDVTLYLNRVYHQLDDLHIEHSTSKATNYATISAGFAIFDNTEQYDLETTLTLTDTALYQAKRSGRNKFIEYGS